MAKRKEQHYNFRFHNPNTDDAFVEVLLRVCIEANKKRVDEIIRAELEKLEQQENSPPGENNETNPLKMKPTDQK